MWIRERRKRLGLNQEELANILEQYGFTVTPGAVSHWETGRNEPPLDNPDFVEAMAKSLKMTTLEILSLSGYKMPTDYSENALRAAYMIEQMPVDKQRLALGILEQILGTAS